DRFSVEEDGACPALAFAASFFGARQPALLAENVEKALHGMSRDLDGLSVEAKLHRAPTSDFGLPPFFERRCLLPWVCPWWPARTSESRIFSGVAGISRTSRPRGRIALTIAGAGPSIGISPTPFAP